MFQTFKRLANIRNILATEEELHSVKTQSEPEIT